MKFQITVTLESLEELTRFDQAMRVAFGGPPTPVPESKTPPATRAPRPSAEVTMAPTAAPKEVVFSGDEAEALLKMQREANARISETRAPTPAPTAAPAAAVDPTTLPYEKTELPALITKLVANDRAAAISLLAEFGAKRGGELKPADWASFAEKAKALIAKGPKT